jgi:CheY-like chemotaxis protein
MQILMVDDEEMIRELLRATLSRDARLELTEASSGEAAVQCAGEQDFDLVLLDVRMPGIDGVEACRQIRALPLDRQPVVVMLTALGQDGDLRRYRDAGADAHVIKPFSPNALLTEVYGLLDIAA